MNARTAVRLSPGPIVDTLSGIRYNKKEFCERGIWMKIKRLCRLLAVMMLFTASASAAPAGYTPAGATKNCFFFGENGYTVEYRYDYEAQLPQTIQGYIDNYNAMLSGDEIDVSFYFVNNSRSMDFTQDLSGDNDIYLDLMSRLTCVDQHAALQIHSMAEYEQLFYQTDHHWNHKGAQQGYEDILQLLDVEDEPYQPAEEIIFDAVYNGSYAKRTGVKNATEHFAVYRYDLPACKITLNGRAKKIGRADAYFAGKYSKDILATHFATYYGGDFGELVYDTGMTHRENLLILCNSYGCSVRDLIGRHFNKTYVVDMREYMTLTGKSMKIHQYIEKNEIDKILILGDVSYFLYGKKLY